jgi:D-sedoheptulose 7-phosphate isomerase
MDIKAYIKNSIDTKTKILNDEKILKTIDEIVNVIVETYQNGGKVLTAGNGGSAGDAQHIAGELVAKFYFNRPALKAQSLAVNTSVLTAISNDFGYEYCFARQIEGIADKGDVFIAISTSGNSANIIKALEAAKKQDVITVGLAGETSAQMDELCDYIIHVPSSSTPAIQEAHIMLGHIICAQVEEKYFN